MLHHCGDATDMVPQSTPKKLFSPLCIGEMGAGGASHSPAREQIAAHDHTPPLVRRPG